MEQIAWVFLAGAVGFLLRGYFGSYVSEKGKNLATKEDVSEITTQVESVKASIQVLAHLRTGYEEQRREWLLSFYDSAVEMLYEKIAARFGDFPSDDGQSLYEFQRSFRALTAALLKRYQRIVVYFDHEDPLRASAEEVVNTAIKVEEVFRQRFSSLKLAILHEDTARKSGDREKYGEAVEKTNAASKSYWDDMDPVASAFREALRRYLGDLNRFLRQADNQELKGT